MLKHVKPLFDTTSILCIHYYKRESSQQRCAYQAAIRRPGCY